MSLDLEVQRLPFVFGTLIRLGENNQLSNFRWRRYVAVADSNNSDIYSRSFPRGIISNCEVLRSTTKPYRALDLPSAQSSAGWLAARSCILHV